MLSVLVLVMALVLQIASMLDSLRCFKAIALVLSLFALASHEKLLADEGLLDPRRWIRGHMPLNPESEKWEALVIDGYFCIGVEPVASSKISSFAFKALAQARKTHDRHV